MIITLNNKLDENHEFAFLVDILNENIQKQNSDIITMLEKMLLSLLVTKLEVFLETETSNWFNKMKLDSFNNVSALSDVVKKEIIIDTYEQLSEDLKYGVISKQRKRKLNNFQLLIDDLYPLKNLDIDFKLTLNSHGSKEIAKILRKIGLENVFKEMEKKSEIQSSEILEGINVTSNIDYESNLNKLINYRNSIIHDDILNSISYTEINEFIENVNLLGTVVENYIQTITQPKETEEVSN